MAANRDNIKTVIRPAENERDLAEIPDNMKAALKIVPARWIDEVLEVALQYQPTPIDGDKKAKEQKKATKEDKDKSSDENHINTH